MKVYKTHNLKRLMHWKRFLINSQQKPLRILLNLTMIMKSIKLRLRYRFVRYLKEFCQWEKISYSII